MLLIFVIGINWIYLTWTRIFSWYEYNVKGWAINEFSPRQQIAEELVVWRCSRPEMKQQLTMDGRFTLLFDLQELVHCATVREFFSPGGSPPSSTTTTTSTSSTSSTSSFFHFCKRSTPSKLCSLFSKFGCNLDRSPEMHMIH